MVYFMEYTLGFANAKYYSKIEAPPGCSWRELQKRFDPKYQFNNLKFYSGKEIINNE